MMIRLKWVSLVMVILMCTLFPLTAAAEDSPAGTSEDAGGGQQLSMFVGNTQDSSENGLSVSLEYEYRWTRKFGVGALAEYAGGDFDSWVVAIPFFIHPHAGWFVRLAPGIELEREDNENNFLFRVGVGYDFEITPHWSLAPEFNVDFVDSGEDKLVYGLSLSREF